MCAGSGSTGSIPTSGPSGVLAGGGFGRRSRWIPGGGSFRGIVHYYLAGGSWIGEWVQWNFTAVTVGGGPSTA